jgi:hypothetical protein
MARKVDHSALRTNQAVIIVLLLVAFIVNVPALVAFVAAVMLIGAAVPQARLFVLLYQYALKPANLLQPDVIEDNPEPHRFSMALGGIFTAASTVALVAGAATIGWALAWVVIILAALNLFAGFCAGCFMYYQFNKFGVPGFDRAPIRG